MARIACTALVVLMLLIVPNRLATAAAPSPTSNNDVTTEADPQSSDWDRDDADFSSLLKEAMRRYSEAIPDTRAAKRLAVDALMLASVTGDTATANKIKRDLLERFPSSVEAGYVMTTFADGKKLREFVDAQFLKEIPDAQKAKLAVRVVRQAFPKFQKDLLEDQSFVLHLTRAAFVAEDRAMCNDGRKALKLNPARVAAVACDDLTPAEQRFRELQELLLKEDFQSLGSDISGFQQHLLTLMTLEERSNPQIRRILARNYLSAGELDKALAQFEFLKDAVDDPQVRFQHGFCLARMRRSDEARAVLKQMIVSNADSEWRPSAEALLGWIENLDEIIGQHAELLTQIIKAYRDAAVEVCDVELEWLLPSGDHVVVTLGVDMLQSRVEIVASKNQIPLFGFSGLSTESTVYVKGEPAILRLPKMAFLPDVNLSDCRIDKSGFHGNTQFTSGSSLNGLRKTTRDLLHNEQLTSKAAMTLLTSGLVGMGKFPQPLETVDGTRIMRFSTADIDRPRLMASSVSVDAAHRLKSARFSWSDHQLEIHRLVLSKWQDHKLTPGNWPNLPTRSVADNDFGSMMRLMGAAFQLVVGEMKTPETAEKSNLDSTPKR